MVLIVASFLLMLRLSPAIALDDPVWMHIVSRKLWIALWIGLSGVVGSWLAIRLCKPRAIREYLYCGLLTWLFTQITLGLAIVIYGAILSHSGSVGAVFASSVGFGVIYFFLLFYYFCYSLPLCLLSAAISYIVSQLLRRYRLYRIRKKHGIKGR